jgi:hypothetical protein
LLSVPFFGVDPGGGFGFETHSVSLVASYGKLKAGSDVGHGVKAGSLLPTFVLALGELAGALTFEFAAPFLLSVVHDNKKQLARHVVRINCRIEDLLIASR